MSSFVLIPFMNPPKISIAYSFSLITAVCSSLVIGKSPLDLTRSHLKVFRSSEKNFLFSFSRFDPPKRYILSL